MHRPHRDPATVHVRGDQLPAGDAFGVVAFHPRPLPLGRLDHLWELARLRSGSEFIIPRAEIELIHLLGDEPAAGSVCSKLHPAMRCRSDDQPTRIESATGSSLSTP
jgi:hypothetical protein